MKKMVLLILTALLFCLSCTGAENPQPYAPGSRAEALPMTDAQGNNFTLTGLLQDKDMVLLCLWAGESDHCRRYFPLLEEISLRYRDQIEIVALSRDPGDTADQGPYSFRFAASDSALGVDVPLDELPFFAVVDRFGVICFTGSVPPDTGAFLRLIDVFVGDDYEASRLLTEIPPQNGLQAPAPALSIPLVPGADLSGSPTEAAYSIRCIDENGRPVPGVMVQICDAATCRVAQTDAEGMHVFTSAPCAWEIHVLLAPAGYAVDGDGVVIAPAGGGEIVLTLKKQ